MRTMKDKKSVELINPSEYLSQQQIVSSFSRMSKQYLQGLIKKAEKVQVIEDLTEDTEDAFLNETENFVDKNFYKE